MNGVAVFGIHPADALTDPVKQACGFPFHARNDNILSKVSYHTKKMSAMVLSRTIQKAHVIYIIIHLETTISRGLYLFAQYCQVLDGNVFNRMLRIVSPYAGLGNCAPQNGYVSERDITDGAFLFVAGPVPFSDPQVNEMINPIALTPNSCSSRVRYIQPQIAL